MSTAVDRPGEPQPQPQPLHCMEIWGGTEAVARGMALPGLDTWVYSRPHEGADRGGDVHYVSLCGGGKITRVIVADVSGHGPSAAEFAGLLRDLLRRNISKADQTGLVRALNRQFAGLAELRRFATAVLLTYLSSTDTLTVSNAGHPRPLWYRADRREWSLLTHDAAGAPARPSNLPLGLDEETDYEQFAVKLGPDDLVVLYTDALIEAASPDGALLGEPGLLALARDLGPLPPSRLGPALLAAVDAHRGGRPADDDVTLLALHHNAGPARRPGPGEMVDVLAKMLGLRPV